MRTARRVQLDGEGRRSLMSKGRLRPPLGRRRTCTFSIPRLMWSRLSACTSASSCCSTGLRSSLVSRAPTRSSPAGLRPTRAQQGPTRGPRQARTATQTTGGSPPCCRRCSSSPSRGAEGLVCLECQLQSKTGARQAAAASPNQVATSCSSGGWRSGGQPVAPQLRFRQARLCLLHHPGLRPHPPALPPTLPLQRLVRLLVLLWSWLTRRWRALVAATAAYQVGTGERQCQRIEGQGQEINTRSEGYGIKLARLTLRQRHGQVSCRLRKAAVAGGAPTAVQVRASTVTQRLPQAQVASLATEQACG